MLVVVIPWRPQPSRIDAFERVIGWYATHLPEAEVRTIDADDDVFNLARARNLGVAAVEDDDPDAVVILNDADTIPEVVALRSAIEGARTSGRVHLPYTEYRWLGRGGTAHFRAGGALDEAEFELVRGACSGVYVTTPGTWWAHGGQDERFRGWGFEDAAWYLAHETLLGEPPRRSEGHVYALHHEPQARSGPQYDANAQLMERYKAAAGSAEAMSALVDEAEAAR